MSRYPGQGHHGPGGGGYPYQQGGYGGPPPGPPPPGYGPGPGYGRPPPGYHGYGHAPPPGPPPPGPGYQPRHYGGPPPGPPPPGPPNHGYNSHGYPRADPYSAHRARSGPPPPTAPQQFGHGAPQGYTFQYSNCSGKRKALLIGINYFGQKGELRGCINDVQNLTRFLIEKHRFKREDMVLLTDDQRDPVMQPTKENIIRGMQWLVRNAQPNDSLFLHYSGHGGQTEDLDGDEDDGYDEVIYPVDHQQNGHIVDDDIHAITVKPLLPGVRLTAIFDSCHSATCMDLPYVYSTKGVLKEPNLAKEAGSGLLDAIGHYARGDIGGVVSTVFSFAKTAYKGDDAYQKTIQTRTSPADVIMWSGSRDDQTSADATIVGKATGAMSYAFIAAMNANPNQSYVELLNSIRDILEDEYSQKPQLSCSHPLDTDLQFII